MSHRLYLLDGMALLYRAHFALIRAPIKTSDGVNTSALFGFTNTLVDIMTKRGATHLAVALDTPAPTARHRLLPGYKAQREEIPEDLALAIPAVKRMLPAFGVPLLEQDGFEADDLIGTVARLADEHGGFETFMVTPDKDFAQLVSETTSMFKPGLRGAEPEIFGPEEIRHDWMVDEPERVIDVLALWGDTADNIPGVKGIGEKTAKKLIHQFGSAKRLLQELDQLKGKQRENLEAALEQVELNMELVRIDRHAPLGGLSLDDLRVRQFDPEKLRPLLVEFEFNAIGKRLLGSDFEAGRGRHRAGAPGAGSEWDSAAGEPAAGGGSQPMLFESSRTLADVGHDYRIIEGAEAIDRLLVEWGAQPAFCFDLETTGLDPRRCQPLGIALCWQDQRAFYLPLPLDDKPARTALLERIAPMFTRADCLKIGHNLKFDLSILQSHGIRAAGPFFDTMLAHALIDPDQRHSMDYLAEAYLGYRPQPLKELIGDLKDPKEIDFAMRQLATRRGRELAIYAAEDADVTWQLRAKLEPLLEQHGVHDVFHRIEAPLLEVLVDMELTGVAIDEQALARASASLGDRIHQLAAEIHEFAGEHFNINSPRQLGVILFEKLKLVDKPKKTRTGQYQTNEQILETLAARHPIVERVLSYREASKLKGTYVDALPAQVSPATGRIHTTFHQLVAATGRLASSDPNLQNIPIRTELGREIRAAFVPGRPGFKLLAADYSQVELRIMASLSEDPAMMEAFEQDLDIHSATAARVFGVDPHDVQPDMRRTAKMVNFGIIYGISAFGLAQRLRIPRAEAASLIEQYFRQYPGVQAYMKRSIEQARERGYAETLSGRRRVLRDIGSANNTVRSQAERMAINTPIQGTAADMIKLAMITVHRDLAEAGLDTRLILQVHDELLFELAPGEEAAVTAMTRQRMVEALPLKVPVVVDVGIGDNWLEAH